MKIKSAKEVAAAASARANMTLEEYISERLDRAQKAGYPDCRMWIRNTSLDEAKKLLSEAGYKVSVAQEDTTGVQLAVSW